QQDETEAVAKEGEGQRIAVLDRKTRAYDRQSDADECPGGRCRGRNAVEIPSSPGAARDRLFHGGQSRGSWSVFRPRRPPWSGSADYRGRRVDTAPVGYPYNAKKDVDTMQNRGCKSAPSTRAPLRPVPVASRRPLDQTSSACATARAIAFSSESSK